VLVHSTEKDLAEHGSKVGEGERRVIGNAIADLKEALKRGGDRPMTDRQRSRSSSSRSNCSRSGSGGGTGQTLLRMVKTRHRDQHIGSVHSVAALQMNCPAALAATYRVVNPRLHQ
jgi:hypothetical protein